MSRIGSPSCSLRSPACGIVLRQSETRARPLAIARAEAVVFDPSARGRGLVRRAGLHPDGAAVELVVGNLQPWAERVAPQDDAMRYAYPPEVGVL